MKQIISKEDVSKAINDLTDQGKKTTLAAIHAALGGRGSMSTLVRLKTEIEAPTDTSNDSAEGLKAFRAVWSAAVDEGQKNQQARIDELIESVSAMAVENDRLEGASLAANNHATELELAKTCAETELRTFKDGVEAELHHARTALAQAEARATDALQKLIDSQANDKCQMTAMRAERDYAVNKAHDIEIKLARALAFLEARSIPANGSN
jgi:hypothetical protein